MKISMKNDLCGVLNNGPLMVSIGGWVNETTGIYPFNRLKKVYPDRTENNSNLLQDNNDKLYEKSDTNTVSDIDLFVLPDHVTSYIVQSESRT